MTSLPIVWQRLVNADGETCERCRATRLEVERALTVLEDALPHLGIEPELEFRELDQAAFDKEPGQSNRVWIAGKALEDWLQAEVGSTDCPSCGDAACRTVEVGDSTFATIPERLILKAALLASAELVDA